MSDEFPEHVTQREAALVGASFESLSREPGFRNIVRLFASRKAQKQPIEPLEKAVSAEFMRFVKRDAGV